MDMGQMDAHYSQVQMVTHLKATWVAEPLRKLFLHHLSPYTALFDQEQPAHACDEPLTTVPLCIQVRGLMLYQILPVLWCVPEPDLNLDLGWNLNLAQPDPTLPVTCLIIHIEHSCTYLSPMLHPADGFGLCPLLPPLHMQNSSLCN